MEELAERQENMTKAQVSRARSSVSYTFGVRCSVEHEGSHSEGEAAAR